MANSDATDLCSMLYDTMLAMLRFDPGRYKTLSGEWLPLHQWSEEDSWCITATRGQAGGPLEVEHISPLQAYSMAKVLIDEGRPALPALQSKYDEIVRLLSKRPW
ncbi:MAG: hypothetical protein KF760_31440 [Candidatus Eremiobacteraeota bacterium]|nr:hypothetical protein [Candidatus Eremiobacteraeota bacterium]MCW5870936.1 hypothetical protein [Candidatus Eremiobacteraeota bacterium]